MTPSAPTSAPTSAAAALPPGMTVLERGWLSANNIVFAADPADPQDDGAAVVDTGYVSHADQTVLLIERTLAGQPLARILNTHLHSDHCGGNAALQARWPQAQTYVAPGQAEFVRHWNPEALSYTPTGQECPPFALTGVLQPGASVRLSLPMASMLASSPCSSPPAQCAISDNGVRFIGRLPRPRRRWNSVRRVRFGGWPARARRRRCRRKDA